MLAVMCGLKRAEVQRCFFTCRQIQPDQVDVLGHVSRAHHDLRESVGRPPRSNLWVHPRGRRQRGLRRARHRLEPNRLRQAHEMGGGKEQIGKQKK